MGQRPWALLVGVLAFVLAGAGVVAAITHEDADEKAPTVQESSTSTTAPEETTTSSTEPPTTTTTTSGAPTTTSRPVTTTVVRPTTTTAPRAAATTTTVTARDCTAAQIEVAATTDKPSYVPGEQINFTSTLRNRSSTTCFYAGYTFLATFADPAGRRIIEFSMGTPGTRSPLVPGAVLTGTVPFDQRACQTQPCPMLAPGPGYSVTATWNFSGGPYQARATFSLG